MNNSVKKCCVCNNEKIGEFITINDNKYHLCCIEELQQENEELHNKIDNAIELYKNCKAEDYCTLDLDMYNALIGGDIDECE
jgi:hypothetical protein